MKDGKGYGPSNHGGRGGRGGKGSASDLNSPAPLGRNDRPAVKTETGTTTKSMKPGIRSRGA